MTFFVQIETGSRTPIFKQIVHQIARAVSRGELEEGTALPSTRALADRLVVNPNTVARAYRELTRQGVIDSQQGKGSFIAKRGTKKAPIENQRVFSQALVAFLDEISSLGMSDAEIKKMLASKLKENNQKE